MKKNVCFWLVSLVAVSLIGCDSKLKEESGTNSPLKAVSTGDKLGNSNSPAQPETNKQEPGLDLAKIPAELKGDAFEYYGLARTEPIKMAVTQNGVTDAATQTVKLTSVENGKALFTITNEGGLSRLGEVLVSLDKEGIKVVSVNGEKADSETFELPSGLKPGKSWPFKIDNKDMKLLGSNVVKGTESVTTAVGTYKDALLIVSTASGNQGSKKVQLKSKQWLVRGRGQVKAEITNVSGKDTQSVTMSETN